MRGNSGGDLGAGRWSDRPGHKYYTSTGITPPLHPVSWRSAPHSSWLRKKKLNQYTIYQPCDNILFCFKFLIFFVFFLSILLLLLCLVPFFSVFFTADLFIQHFGSNPFVFNRAIQIMIWFDFIWYIGFSFCKVKTISDHHDKVFKSAGKQVTFQECNLMSENR